MDPEARYTMVGTAVLVLLALVVAAVLWLRTTGGGGTDRQYKIYFVTQSLEGLEVRSDVRMRGIRVGSATGFTFSSRRRGAVEVFIRVDSSAPVRQSTEAVVERHLVTGIASIRLINPSELSPLLTATPEDEPYPVIAEGESAYEQLSESVNQLAQRTDETMQRITATLSPENQAALTEVLKNLRALTRDADKTVLAAARAADEVRGAGEEMRKLAVGIAADAHTLTARYDALGKQAGTSLGDITGEVRAMREDVAKLAARADRLLANGDVGLGATAQALGSAAAQLGSARRRARRRRRPAPRSRPGSLRAAQWRPGSGRRAAMNRLFAVSLLAVAAGCLPSGGTREAQRYYVLDAPEPKSGAAVVPRPTTLVVPPTGTANFYDTQDLVFSRSAGTRAYYQFNSWTERPGRAIHELLVSRLERSGAFKTIVGADRTIANSLVLRTDLEEIYHDATTSPGEARIVLTAELIDSSRSASLARRSFSQSAPAPTYDAQGAVQGFRQALGALLDEVCGWAIEQSK